MLQVLGYRRWASVLSLNPKRDPVCWVDSLLTESKQIIRELLWDLDKFLDGQRWSEASEELTRGNRQMNSCLQREIWSLVEKKQILKQC